MRRHPLQKAQNLRATAAWPCHPAEESAAPSATVATSEGHLKPSSTAFVIVNEAELATHHSRYKTSFRYQILSDAAAPERRRVKLGKHRSTAPAAGCDGGEAPASSSRRLELPASSPLITPISGPHDARVRPSRSTLCSTSPCSPLLRNPHL